MKYIAQILIAIVSMLCAFMVLENALYIIRSQQLGQPEEYLIMPEEFERRHVEVPGAYDAYYWLDILHIFNTDYMRRITPYTKKDPTIFRILVFGDSFTYGQGVRIEEIYPVLLEHRLKSEYRVEVFNMGVQGYQSEDILRAMKRFVPELRPDLVVYGVCTNDFLPSHRLEESNYVPYRIPFPESWKLLIIQKSYLAKISANGYNAMLMRLKLRHDYENDNDSNVQRYKSRFMHDVTEMNELVLEHGLPPVLTMVLDQYPSDAESRRISTIIEGVLLKTGTNVISLKDYYLKYSSKDFSLNRWDGHPNAEAHKIFAGYILQHLLALPQLANYKKS